MKHLPGWSRIVLLVLVMPLLITFSRSGVGTAFGLDRDEFLPEGETAIVLNPDDHGDAYYAELAKDFQPFVVDLNSLNIAAADEKDELGEWSDVIQWPSVAVSMSNLPDGRIISWSSNLPDKWPGGEPEQTYTTTWNPITEQFDDIFFSGHDMFCAHQVMLEDGSVFVNGGRNTVDITSTFDYQSDTWSVIQPMQDPRWYPTTVALPNGEVFTVSGNGGTNTAEIWMPGQGWDLLTNINWAGVVAEPGFETKWWPYLHVAPNGKLFHSGPTQTMHWVETAGEGNMIDLGTRPNNGEWFPKYGSAVMYDEGKILLVGGQDSWNDVQIGGSSRAMLIDITGETPVITEAAPMNYGRAYGNAVILPTGEVMVMGGNTSGKKFNDDGSQLTPEIWNPNTGQWRVMSDMSVPRNYHSTALLTIDGRVLSAGGGFSSNSVPATTHQDAQVFTPPYLFNTDGTPATRPEITTAPGSVRNSETFVVDTNAAISKFSLIRMSSVTHGINTDQRYLAPAFTHLGGNQYELTAHSNINVLTPGYYFLFAVDDQGVPSIAHPLQITTEGTPKVTNPGPQFSGEGDVISLLITATDADSSTLTYSAAGLPAGLSMNSSTGLISGTIAQGSTGEYDVTVQVVDEIGGPSLSFSWTVTPEGTGQILREWWTEIDTTAVSALTGDANFPENPSGTDFRTSFEAPVNWAEDYGTRMRGYLHPPVTGDYTFWIASDDNGELWLSTDDSPANATMIANVPGWSSSQDWDKFAEQQSATISLAAGQTYYIEALQKENGGGDNLAVAWQIPGGAQELITGSYLSPASALSSNLALNGGAAQSSTYVGSNNYDAANAIDGNTSGDASDDSITHTNSESEAWWELDLGSIVYLDTIRLWNRTDCCDYRLSDFYVLISETPFTSTSLNTALGQAGVKAYHFASEADVHENIVARTMGRYVRVQLAGTNFLQLAEVQVWGSVIESAPTMTSPGTQTNYIDQTISLPISAGDIDGDVLTFSANGLPAGLTIDANSGTISGVLAAGSEGHYDATVTVSDGVTDTAVSFTWNVLPLGAVLSESGTLTVDQTSSSSWHTVNLQYAYVNPIVVLSPPTYNDADPTTVRVRSVTTSQFEFQIDEWDYLNGAHDAETIHFLVVEAGTYSLPTGRQLQAGSSSVDSSWNTISLAAGFSNAPVVLTQAASVNEAEAVATRLRNAAVNEFQLRLQEEEANDDLHSGEQVHWIAVEPGVSTNRFEAGLTPDAFEAAWYTITFANSYTTPPTVFGTIQTNNSSDTSAVRSQLLDTASVQMLLEEEQSNDTETGHVTEILGYLVLAAENDTDPFGTMLGPVNNPPAITLPGNQTNAEGEVVSLLIEATDAEGSALTYSASALPDGVTIDTATGQISGALLVGTAGSYSITITVSDGSDTSTVSFIWTVTAAPGGWVNFTDESTTRLVAPSDSFEKDTAVADLNQDGWDDIIVVRKTPFDALGGQTDLLLMNVDGVLTDLTSTYAPAFITNNTDARDVLVADIDGDGWQDVVVASTFEDPPVLYRNLGEDAQGNWLGLADESSRLPASFDTGTVQFCAVTSGDVNGDGHTDLYFANYAFDGGAKDVLLINNGSGSFTEESQSRLGDLRWSAFGTSVQITDMDADGDQDIVKLSAEYSVAPWNKPGIFTLFNDGSGTFTQYDEITTNAAYMFMVADLNNDGLQDLFVQDDAQDYVKLGAGAMADVDVSFTELPLTAVQTSDHGGNFRFADLDFDGDLDLGIADVDTMWPPCDTGPDSFRKFTLLLNDGSGFLSDPYGGVAHPWSLNTFDFEFIDINRDGNLDIFAAQCAGYGVYVNTAVPAINQPPILTNPADQANVEGDTVALTLTAVDADGDTLTYSATGLPNGLTLDTGTGDIAGTVPFGSAASYTVTVTVTDGALSDSATFTWTITDGNQPPSVTNPGDQTNAEGETVSLTISAADADGDALTFSATGLPAGLSLDSGSGQITGLLPFDSAGTTSVTVTVSDGTTSDSAVFNWTVTNTNQLPAIVNPGDQTNSEGDTVSLTISASDADGDSLIFSSSGLPTGLSIDSATGEISGMTSAAGSYTPTVTVSDGSDTADTTFDWTVEAVSVSCGPLVQEAENGTLFGVFTTATDAAASGGAYIHVVDNTAKNFNGASGAPDYAEYCFTITDPGTYQVNATIYAADYKANSFYMTVDGEPADGYIWDFYPVNSSYVQDYVSDRTSGADPVQMVLTEGDHTVRFYLREDGSRLDKFEIEQVVVANNPPLVTHPGDQTNEVGDAVSLSIEASDLDGDALSYSAAGLPAGLSIDGSSGTISGTADAAGSFDVTVTVSDGSDSSTVSFAWTVSEPNVAPTITNPGTQTHAEGESVNLPISADDANGDALTFSAAGLPANLTIDVNSGVIAGALTYDSEGSTSVTVTVSDGTLTAQTTFTWEVTHSEPPAGSDIVYFSSTSNGSVGGISFADEDIVRYDTVAGTWSLYFDGSDVGLGGNGLLDVDAFHVRDDGSLLLSFKGDDSIPDVGLIDNSDIILFTPTSTGESTAGTFSIYLDGSDVGLDSGGEDVTAVSETAAGDLIISTIGSNRVGDLGTNRDEDLLLFAGTFGETTSGTWSLLFDGSDADLDSSLEEIYGISQDPTTGDLYMALRGDFDVSGAAGGASDILGCYAPVTGPDSSCAYALYLAGTDVGWDGENIDGIFVERP